MVDAGVEVKTAINHWQLAIDTHNTNHPQTDHDCIDVRMTHPARYPKTDIFWASPECKSHSLAKGRQRRAINQLDLWGDSRVDPAEERSRATMREVVEFAEYHRNPIVIVENVVDIRRWQHYTDWLLSMERLGYNYKTLYLNAKFFGVAQSRDRWYMVFWLRGNKTPDLDFRPRAYCQNCDEHVDAVQAWKKPEFPWGRYGRNRQYIYRCPRCTAEVQPSSTPAHTVIDWSLPAERIGDRDRPLKPRTIKRIEAGLKKFANKAVVVDLGHMHAAHNGKVYDVGESLPTQTTRQTLALAVPPFLMHYYTRDNAQSMVDEPVPTITTEPRFGVVMPPIITPLRGTATSKGVDEALTTIVAAAAQHALVIPPWILAYYGSNSVYDGVDEALPGITTVQRHAFIQPEDLVEDCRFRMLEPEELKLGMSFPGEYVVLGSKRNQVRQIGNAVACLVAQWIVERCIESLH